MTFRLTSESLDATRAKLEQINARARRKGFTGNLEIQATRVEVPITVDGIHIGHEVRYDTVITGEPPQYGGWSFVAAVDKVGDGMVVRRAPGTNEIELDREKIVPGECDHCGTTRRRNATFIVRHAATGETKQVGATCIKDFTGWDGRPVFISESSVEDELSGVWGRFDATFQEPTTSTVLAAAIAIVDTYGYQRGSTSELVFDLLYGTTKHAQELRANIRVVGPERVDEVVSTILAQEPDSEYMENLHAILRSGAVSWRHRRLTVSAVAAYQRIIGRDQERKARVDAWIGERGQRLPVTGRVTKVVTLDGYMPNTYSRLVVIETDQGTVKTFTTAQWAWDVERGGEVSLVGTVKDHEEYEGRKETVMTRLSAAKTS